MKRRYIPPAAKRQRVATLQLLDSFKAGGSSAAVDAAVDAMLAAHRAQQSGKAKHAKRRRPVDERDWQPVYDLVVRAHPDVLAGRIYANRVLDVLHELGLTEAIKDAECALIAGEGDSAFIRWVRRRHNPKT